MKLDEKIKVIADHYGMDIQITKLAEECAEFAAAMLKWHSYDMLSEIRPEAKDFFHDKLVLATADSIKEMADVFVLVKQIEYLLETHPEELTNLKEIMNAKCTRQLVRIEEENASKTRRTVN